MGGGWGDSWFYQNLMLSRKRRGGGKIGKGREEGGRGEGGGKGLGIGARIYWDRHQGRFGMRGSAT